MDAVVFNVQRNNVIRKHTICDQHRGIHADELEQYKKGQLLLHKFGLSYHIDRKQLRTERAQLEQKIEILHLDLDAGQSELDELKNVRYWVRKVIPDALSSRTEGGALFVRETMERRQNTIELITLLEQTVEQVSIPHREEIRPQYNRVAKPAYHMSPAIYFVNGGALCVLSIISTDILSSNVPIKACTIIIKEKNSQQHAKLY